MASSMTWADFKQRDADVPHGTYIDGPIDVASEPPCLQHAEEVFGPLPAEPWAPAFQVRGGPCTGAWLALDNLALPHLSNQDLTLFLEVAPDGSGPWTRVAVLRDLGAGLGSLRRTLRWRVRVPTE